MRDWLYPGAKVVCVYDLSSAARPGVKCPAVGGVYTIRDAFTESRFNGGGEVFVRLGEIINTPDETAIGPYEPAFHCEVFRPLQKRKTSIEVFERLLNTAPEKPLVEA